MGSKPWWVPVDMVVEVMAAMNSLQASVARYTKAHIPHAKATSQKTRRTGPLNSLNVWFIPWAVVTPPKKDSVQVLTPAIS